MNGEPGGPDRSTVYERVTEEVSSACESVIEDYVAGRGGRLVPEVVEILRSDAAAVFAEGAALEAMALLAERRGELLDLYFTQPTGDGQFGMPSPAMHDLVIFLRSRLSGQDAVLRLPVGTPPVAFTLLLIAAQAITQAGEDRQEATRTVFDRLRNAPVELVVRAGDLAYALDGVHGYRPEQVRRDQVRRILTGAVPLDAAGLSGEHLWLALNLNARPDIRGLMSIFAADPLPGGAETRTEWSLLPGNPALVRLSIDCIEPVLVRFAIAFDLSRHREVLDVAARSDQLLVVGREPGAEAAGQERLSALIVPHNGRSLARLLAQAAG
ncbi:MAG TPA: hypothetical protein VFN97_00940 [Actinospica sp.]|nr:hypothetical protein [Actinospica sp.]